jgi:hypothetical protein
MFMRDGQTSKELVDAAYIVRKSLYGTESKPPTREEIAMTGLVLWPITYKGAEEDDYKAFDGLMRWAESQDNLMVQASVLIPSEQISLMGSARWADQAFPRFIMSHTYASALMATGITEDVVEHVRAPYKAFMIDVPDGLLSTVDTSTGTESKIKFILVHHMETGTGRPWQYIAYTDSAIHMWRHGVDTKNLCEPDLPENKWEGCSFIAPKDERDDRVSALIGRLIVGVCLAAIEPSNVRPTSHHASKPSPEQMRPSDIRTFKLGKPVKFDCRKAINEYVTGRRHGPPTVRTLVRGHWRTQRHGPQLSLKKVIWLQPFWRGPEDAPILVRPTEMGDLSRR